MLFVDAETVNRTTPWTPLMDALAAALRAGSTQSPPRHVHDLAQSDGSTGALLLMPSWVDHEAVGVKVVTYFPANATSEHPTVNAAYLLFDGETGLPVATIDGDALTARRTAAVSALAARQLARPDSKRLLVVGTGQLAPNLAMAHAADIISCATGATSPLIKGGWLSPGTHLDLVGGFRPDMRESDNEAVRTSTVFVDTVAGASVSGDLAQPLESGVMSADDIAADLAALVGGEHPGRHSDEEVTLFKSAGFAAADLAAARLVVDAVRGDSGG